MVDFSENDADLFLECGSWPASLVCKNEDLSFGDFDGDGYPDLGLDDIGPASSLGRVIYGGPFPTGSSLVSFRRTGFQGYSGSIFSLGTRVVMGNVIGDEKDDLVFYSGDSNPPKVYVVRGRSTPPTDIPAPADLTIEGRSGLGQDFGKSLALGDINGDGLKDILIGAKLAGGGGEVYVVYGKVSFPSATISVTNPTYCMTITGAGGGGLGEAVASGDIDGDGNDEILMADRYRTVGSRTNAGEVYVIRGSSALPALWALETNSAHWTLSGSTSSFLSVFFAADFTGDGKADIGLSKSFEAILVSGADITSGGSTIDLVAGQPNSLVPTTFTDSLGRSGEWGTPGDFDGDTRPDLPILWHKGSEPEKEIALYLSHSLSSGASLPPVLSSASVRITRSANQFTDGVLGDLNGDGKSDLVFSSPQQDGFRVFYGFWPLENPWVQVQSRDSNQARVHLSVGVDGEPAEMKLTGDLVDPVPDMWVPYRSKIDVTLSPLTGDKSIDIVFRTVNRRESNSVTTIIPLTLNEGEAGASVVTNILRAGGSAKIEARMEAAGMLKASAFSREGRLLRVLIDEEKGPGVHVFAWDGANSDGVRVAPGIYTVVVDAGGKIDRCRVLVK